MALGAGVNTDAWTCGAVGDQFLGGIEHWGPGVLLPAAVGLLLVLRARTPRTSLDWGLFFLSIPLVIYAAITWVMQTCVIDGPAP